MKKILKFSMLLILLFSIGSLKSQISFIQEDKITSKIVSLYEKNNFIDCRLVKLRKHNYLACVIELPKQISTDIDRIAQVKAQRLVSEFINGVNVNSNSTIILEEISNTKSNSNDSSLSVNNNSEYYSRMIDKIKTNSQGFINGIQCLLKKESSNHQKYIYIFIREIE